MADRDIALFNNNATSTLASPITNSALACSVVPGAGALFPNPGAGQYFIMTFVDQATRLIREIVHVTNRVGDVMTIVRGQEGTTPLAWSAGDICAQLPTAGTNALFSQLPQSQAQATNYAVDTGTANNYVAAFSPVVNVRVTGLIMRIKATNANSGASTLDAGAGPISITNPDGSALGTGAIVANGIFEVVDPGSGAYQLTSSSQQAQSLSGAATTGDVKWRPTSESISGWVPASGRTIGNAASGASQLASATAANLFAWHWNNFSNTQCPTFTSAGAPVARGANAAADFAANRRIQILFMAGIMPIGASVIDGNGTSSLDGVPVESGSISTPGSIIGENLHQLTLVETPTGITVSNAAQSITVTSTGNNVFKSNGVVITASAGTGGAIDGVQPGTGSLASVSSSGTNSITATSNNTGNGNHNTVSRSMTGYWYLKL